MQLLNLIVAVAVICAVCLTVGMIIDKLYQRSLNRDFERNKKNHERLVEECRRKQREEDG